MKVIYKPKGRAGEYAEYALEIIDGGGCIHGCVYCYAARGNDSFHDTKSIKIRKNLLVDLEKDLKEFKGKEVFLTFSSDPCQESLNDVVINTTCSVVKMLHNHGIIATVLTKGKLDEVDKVLKVMKKNPKLSKLGITSTTLDYNIGASLEPNAEVANSRPLILRVAHDLGIYTFISLEPVIIPTETLKVIEKTHTYVDEFKVGKLNHHPLEKYINWSVFRDDVIALLDKLGKKYIIKHDLLVAGK
ncbi:MAG: hypothetical protein KAS32_16720 [Candidatus Peribacteraceae bacterium]|nr:hypothetical protein [Candidatus Peribacteraceae bacterium]